jgi:hypothetical protein
MKVTRFLYLLAFCFALIILCWFVNETNAQNCAGDAGVGIAQAYALAISYPDSVPEFVQRNAVFFQQNGAAIQCGQILAATLQSAALLGPSPQSIREQAMDVAGRSGRPDLGPKVADDMLRTRSDLQQLASYIQDLVNTLPAAAKGDLAPYHSTNLYRFSKYIWTLSSGLLSPGDMQAIRNMTMQMSEWYVKGLANTVQTP